jgi:type 1 glutamine amidotransferase
MPPIRTFAIFTLFWGLLSCQVLQAKQFEALLFTKTQGFHHSSILEGVAGLQALSKQHNFTLTWHEDAGIFTPEKLKQYQVIIFLNTTGDLLNKAQQKAMEAFIQSGKGFVGIHSAAATEYDWEWYGKLLGRRFIIHPRIQTAKLLIENQQFIGMETLPKHFTWTDEYYEFGKETSGKLNYLLTVDEQTYEPYAIWKDKGLEGKGMGQFHPIAWYQNFDGGRSFYTSLGHLGAAYTDPMFMAHVYGGIFWAATGKGENW